MPNGGAPGAAARISVTRLATPRRCRPRSARARPTSRSTTCRQRRRPPLAVPSSALALLRIDPARWPLSDERVRRALSLALDRDLLALSDGGDVAPARSLLLDPQAPARRPGRSRRPRARCCARAGAEGTLQLALWAEPGTQERMARAIASQLSRDRRRRSTCASRPRGSGPTRRARGSSGWPRPTAIPRRSSCRSPMRSRRPRPDGDHEARPAHRAARRRCAPCGVPPARRTPRRRRSRCDSAAARKLFHADLVHAGWKRHPSRLRHRPRPAHHTPMTAPRPSIHSRRSARWRGCGSPWPRTARPARSSAPRSTSTSSTATTAASGARWPRPSSCTCARRRRAPCPTACSRCSRPARSRRRGLALRAGGLRRRRLRGGGARHRRRGLELVATGAHAVGRGAALRDRRRLERERQPGRPAAES